MDIKETNIFVDAGGLWWLGDFGSCVEVGHPIRSTTPVYNPRGHAEGRRSEFWYDWQMLAMLLLRQSGEKVDGSSDGATLAAAAGRLTTRDEPQSAALSALVQRLLGLQDARY
jgi:hypothetical protein